MTRPKRLKFSLKISFTKIRTLHLIDTFASFFFFFLQNIIRKQKDKLKEEAAENTKSINQRSLSILFQKFRIG